WHLDHQGYLRDVDVVAVAGGSKMLIGPKLAARSLRARRQTLDPCVYRFVKAWVRNQENGKLRGLSSHAPKLFRFGDEAETGHFARHLETIDVVWTATASPVTNHESQSITGCRREVQARVGIPNHGTLPGH